MTAKLTTALCSFYADVNTIHKDSKGNFGKYADLATVLSAVNPALAKNGLAVAQTFDITESGDQLLITTLLHSSGESISSRIPLTIAKGRNPLHDWGGATTYQRRYALLAILNLAAGIEDDDGDSATQAPPPAATSARRAPAASRKRAAAPAAPSAPQDAPAAAPAPAQGKPITQEDRNLILSLMKELDPAVLQPVLEQFRQTFNIGPDVKVSAAIATQEHLEMLQAAIAEFERG